MSPRKSRRTATPAAEPLFADEPVQGAAAASLAPTETGGSLDVNALGAASVGSPRQRAAARSISAPRQLPFSKQFSPSQIPSLGTFLQAIQAGGNSVGGVRSAVFALLYPTAADTDRPRVRMAYNAVLSAGHYGLVNEAKDRLSPFGAALLAMPDDAARLRAFARHILLNLNGLELVSGIAQLSSAGRRLTKVPLAEYFDDHGLASNRDGTDINALTGWLEAAGVYDGGGWYRLNEPVFMEISGLELGLTRTIAGLSAENTAILEQLAARPGHGSTSGEMQRLLKGRTDLHLDAPNFVTRHLRPLEAAGLITLTKATAGRGGESTALTGTDLFDKQVVQELVERIVRQGFHVTGPELSRPFAELVAELKADTASKDARGRALELFTLRLLHVLGLGEIGLRLRPTQSEEIDAWAEGFSPVHARWQVQCKNTQRFTVEQAAKEVGVAVRQRSTVVMLVTTGDFTDDALDYINDVIRSSPITIVRLNGSDVDVLSADETAIWRILDREAHRAHAIRTGVVERLAVPASKGAGPLTETNGEAG